MLDMRSLLAGRGALLTTLWLAVTADGTKSEGASTLASRRIAESLSPFPNATISTSNPRELSLLHGLQVPRPAECPPCSPFNCLLPAFTCLNDGNCNDYNGQCICPQGFGGEDCSKTLCGSLADGADRYPREGDTCECEEGWGGVNCNVCKTNQACNKLLERDSGRLTEGDDEGDAVCYKEGYGIKEVFQMCDVTNRKIVDMLPDRPPQVTFTCNLPEQTCGFQFWIGQVESFYCGLSNCTSKLEMTADSNSTEYSCDKMQCACIPGRMLCGENGSVDLTDYLDEEITGPGKFTSRTGQASTFEEPAMNQLITDVFGDGFITLQCESGECMHAIDVPGFVPRPKSNSVASVGFSTGIVVAVVVLAIFLFWYLGRVRKHDSTHIGRIRLRDDDDDAGKSLLVEHVPATLQFSNLSYTLPNGRLVLDSITGSVQPGQIMAIIGASGAGKSTFLDLVAKRSKKGLVTGDILVNGRKAPDSEYKRVVGFVDQEDTLMGTLTVYETVMNSALLRLPRDMSYEDKKMRVLETMHELGILGIRDSRIGESGKRSISGGEKRRVSIACELVTSPSLLFLDEPTSGLDSFNAFNVVESLVTLSRTYNRTVVFTIHQPRSNIVALFDKLILLASGKMIYSGAYSECQGYFEGVGWKCPLGFNIADYLIDITMQADDRKANHSQDAESALIQLEGEQDAVAVPDPELGVRSRSTPVTTASLTGDETKLETRTPDSSASSIRNVLPFFRNGNTHAPSLSLSPRLKTLVESYSSSEIAQATSTEISKAKAKASSLPNGSAGEQSQTLSPYKRASRWTQFTILSGRSFKNLYRNPMLMLSHYAVSVVVACICGFLYRNVTNDIPGFQNRMGLFFFLLALFGFGCLTSLGLFASERLLFTRERANGYYSPLTYFCAKLLFDIVPLRVIPPFILGAIVYPPVGLVPAVDSFWRFILVLILFNLTASSTVLFLSVVIKDGGVANLVGSLVMLFNLLFAGLLINRDKLPHLAQWLETASFFHAAFEALLVNEVRYLQLTDHRYGVDIEVPAATILSMFGFRAQAFWMPDIILLVSVFAGLTGASFLALVFLVKERR